MKTGIGRQLDPNRRSKAVEDFEHTLRRKIIGQDSAIDAVVDVYQMYTAGLNPPHRPIGNLLFLGPTGTGKTRVVEAMAETLFGDDHAFIRIDCGEFQHSHEISKLIGSPPGYLGHRETHPVLTQESVNQWHTDKLRITLLLIDEVEKASDALWQLLLGVLDKATLTLGDNRRVDLSSCFIIMTSNLGAGAGDSAKMGFGASDSLVVDNSLDDKITRGAKEAAKRKFSPEFLNRIDKTVVFKTLRREHLEQILELELEAVQQRILTASGNSQFVFGCSNDVKLLLLREGINPKYGARHLKRAIERNLVFPLSNLVATNQIRVGDLIRVGLDDEELTFTVESENSLMPIMLARSGDLGLKKASELSATVVEPEIEDVPNESAQRAKRNLRRAEDGLRKSEEGLRKAKDLQDRLDNLLHGTRQVDQRRRKTNTINFNRGFQCHGLINCRFRGS